MSFSLKSQGAATNQERAMMARVRYSKRFLNVILCNVHKEIFKAFNQFYHQIKLAALSHLILEYGVIAVTVRPCNCHAT